MHHWRRARRACERIDQTPLGKLKTRLAQLSRQSDNLPFILGRVELQLLDLRPQLVNRVTGPAQGGLAAEAEGLTAAIVLENRHPHRDISMLLAALNRFTDMSLGVELDAFGRRIGTIPCCILMFARGLHRLREGGSASHLVNVGCCNPFSVVLRIIGVRDFVDLDPLGDPLLAVPAGEDDAAIARAWQRVRSLW